MAFNAQSAITYNNACGYDGNLIKIILLAVRAPFGWEWNVAGVTAISNWQRMNKLDDDGMVGLKSLNRMIYELEMCGKQADAESLKMFIVKAKANQAAQAAKNKTPSEIVSKFSAPKMIFPFRFEKEYAFDKKKGQKVLSWAARGTFEVKIKLNSALSMAERMRYEYRQYIKGEVLVQDGALDASGRWQPTGDIINVGKEFAIPPDPDVPGEGLTKYFKEDGKTAEDAGNLPFRFGYRDQEFKTNRFQNLWSPHASSGHELTVRDTPGFGASYKQGVVPKIYMSFTFRGKVVQVETAENANGDEVTKIARVLDDRTWQFPSFYQILDWDRAVQAVG